MKFDLVDIAIVAVIAYIAVWGGNHVLVAMNLSKYQA